MDAHIQARGAHGPPGLFVPRRGYDAGSRREGLATPGAGRGFAHDGQVALRAGGGDVGHGFPLFPMFTDGLNLSHDVNHGAAFWVQLRPLSPE